MCVFATCTPSGSFGYQMGRRDNKTFVEVVGFPVSNHEMLHYYVRTFKMLYYYGIVRHRILAQ